MKVRPIIFSAPMVRALLDGRKTQTRRLLSLRGYRHFSQFGPSDTPGYDWHFRREDGCWCDFRAADLPLLYVPGDRLWVREALGWNRDGDNSIFYRADLSDISEERVPPGYSIHNPHCPSIFMPRWASRLTLTVTDVRVERVQEIGAEEALAEGLEWESADPPFVYVPGILPHSLTAIGVEDGKDHERRCFGRLWNILHDKPGDRWGDNPWVEVISFTARHGNIDDPEPLP